MNILYVEDNPDDAEITTRILSQKRPDFAVDIANCLSTGLEFLEKNAHYDLVLTDFNLPDGDGLTLVKEIRSRALPYAVAIITGHYDEKTIVAALKAGANDYIIKDSDYLDHIVENIEAIVTHHLAERNQNIHLLKIFHVLGDKSEQKHVYQYFAQFAPHMSFEFESSSQNAIKILNNQIQINSPDIIILDHKPPYINALEILKNLSIRETAIIIVTEPGNPALALQALKLGVTDYVVKDKTYLQRLPAIISNAFHRSQLVREHLELHRTKNILQAILKGTARNTGISFFTNLVIELAQALNHEYVFIGKCDEYDPQSIHTVVFSASNQIQENFHYNLSGTPCENVVGKKICIYQNGVQELFPDDKALSAMGVDSYMGVPLFASNGKPLGVIVTMDTAPMQNIELGKSLLNIFADRAAVELERLQQESKTELQSTALSAAANAIMITDAKGKIEWVNHAFTELTGYTFDEVIGNTPQLLKSGEQSPDFYRNLWQTIINNQVWRGEIINKYKDGSLHTEEVTITPVTNTDGAITHFVSIKHDITQRKLTQSTLQRQLKDLTILQQVGEASSLSNTSDEIISKVTEILSQQIYDGQFGVLLFDEKEMVLVPHPSYQGIENIFPFPKIAVGDGIVGQVIKSGQAMLIADVTQEQNYIDINPNTRSELAVPMKLGERLIGVLNAESPVVNFFTKDDERLLTTIANQIGITLERIRLFDIETKRREEAEKLRIATTAIASSIELNTLLDTILTAIETLIPFDSASVILSENGENIIAAGRRLPKGYDFIGKSIHAIKKWETISASQEPMIMEDAQTHPLFTPIEGTEYIRGWMGLPLVWRNQVIGYITLDSKKANAFSEENALLAQTFVNQAATAIQNARLYEAEQRRRREAEILQNSATALASSLDLDQAIQIILEQLALVLPYDSASVQILQDDHLVNVGGRGWPEPELILGMRFPIPGDNPNTTAVKERRPVFLNNAPEQHTPFREPINSYVKSWLGVPLIARNEVIGLLTVDSRQYDYFTEEHARLASAFAVQAATALANAQLFDSEQRQRQEAENLQWATEVISSSLQLEFVLEGILSALQQVVHYDSSAIFLLGDDGLHLTNARGFPNPEKLKGLVIPSDDTLFLEICNKKSAVYIAHAQHDPRFRKAGDAEHVKSWIGIPLISRGEVFGYITLDNRIENAYTEHETALAQVFGHQAATAITNAQLYDTAIQASNRRSILHRASQDVITANQDPYQTYTALHQATKELMPCDAFVISLLTPDKKHIDVVYMAEKDTIFPERIIDIDQGLSGQVIRTGEAIIIEDLNQSSVEGIHFGEPEQVHSVIAVPMHIGGSVIGMISAQTYQIGAYSEEEKILIEMLASYGAIAIENSRLFFAMHHRMTDLEAVSQISKALRATKRLIDILPILLKETLSALKVHESSIWLYNVNTDKLQQHLAQGWSTALYDVSFAPNISPIGKSFASGEIVQVENIEDEFKSLFPDRHFSGQSNGMCIPVRSTTNIIGVICVSRHKNKPFSEENIHLLKTIAEIAGNSIQRAALHEQTELQVERLTALREIDTAISSSFDERVILDVILEHTLNQLNVNAADILLWNPNLHTLNYKAGRGFRSSALSNFSLLLGEGIAGKVALDRKTVLLDTDHPDAHFLSRYPLLTEKFTHYGCVPLLSKGQIKGVLEIFNREPFESNSEWVDFLHTIAGQAAIAIDNTQMLENLQRSNDELTISYDTTLDGWGRALELRDKETQGHTQRVTDLTVRLAQRVGIIGNELLQVRRGASLHDIGKMGIPDHILHKAEELSPEEWDIMKQHTRYAQELLAPIPYLRKALDIPTYHHEKWDGSGYPYGLKGEQIPLAARLFAIVDVWDALLSDRPYRPAWEKAQVIEYMEGESGRHFDPNILKIFIKMVTEE